MKTDFLQRALDREPDSEAEIRSILQRILRLLAGEVARQLLAQPNDPRCSRPSHDD